ncbi:MAG: 4Fe-4S binding protein [Methanoregula sp.]|nr:4Fe-4S binding protein [Methanoregula sp.]
MRPFRIIERLCTGCGNCLYYCKENTIRIKNGMPVLVEDKCVQCGVCGDWVPTQEQLFP